MKATASGLARWGALDDSRHRFADALRQRVDVRGAADISGTASLATRAASVLI
jgi:hypothetical protein